MTQPKYTVSLSEHDWLALLSEPGPDKWSGITQNRNRILTQVNRMLGDQGWPYALTPDLLRTGYGHDGSYKV